MEGNDQIFLTEAVRLARENVLAGGGPFGAVIVKHGILISTGVNRVTLHHDPTAHAEVQAIRKAGEILGDHELKECVMYASCEPCPMCLGAIYWAQIERVVYASSRYDAANGGFRDAELYHEVAAEPEDRKIECTQVAVPGAGKEFEDWVGNEDRIDY